MNTHGNEPLPLEKMPVPTASTKAKLVAGVIFLSMALSLWLFGGPHQTVATVLFCTATSAGVVMSLVDAIARRRRYRHYLASVEVEHLQTLKNNRRVHPETRRMVRRHLKQRQLSGPLPATGRQRNEP